MENIAREYLEDKAFELIESNFNCRYGEIDLIMRQGEWIVFVEVKSVQQGSPLSITETITQGKLNRLSKAIRYWLTAKHAHHEKWRLDFVGILAQDDEVQEIHHFPNI